MAPDFIYNLPPGDVIYDIETYPNVFTVTFLHCDTDQGWQFEISDAEHDQDAIRLFFRLLQGHGNRLVGFNNLHFDYPVMHTLLTSPHRLLAEDLYTKAMEIIRGNAFAHTVWEKDWIVPQIDLFKIHHFDNRSKSTSLKKLEFAMRMCSVEDLPFPVGTMLDGEQIVILKDYNWYDCIATKKFYDYTREHLAFRAELTQRYGRNFMNHNDTKIGKDFFITRLEEAKPGSCYRYIDGRRRVVQTQRDSIDLSQVVFPYVQFSHPEFQRILDWFKSQTITETNGVFKGVNCTINGFQFNFGTGGIHGSVTSRRAHSDDTHMILDVDVSSYYPSMAIKNHLYPAHLGEKFYELYQEMYEERKKHAKKTPVNEMLKLALNGVYGDSNNPYSAFFDPQYTMSITINGQLLLCMLAEALMAHGDVEMLQINTDGLTIRCPRSLHGWVRDVQAWWEGVTGLTLEEGLYRRMFIRDVNSYIAEFEDGSLKRIGAYAHERAAENPATREVQWHKDHSALVVPKAVEAHLIRGEDIRQFILAQSDIHDFLLFTKAPARSHLEWGGEDIGKMLRYYVSTDGDTLEKVLPATGPEGEYKKALQVSQAYYLEVMDEIGPGVWDERIHTKNKSQYGARRTGIHTGWTVQPCNDLTGHEFNDINYEFYIAEAEKLVV